MDPSPRLQDSVRAAFGGFAFTDRPAPVALSEYAAARSSLVDYLSARQDVVALYEYGSVSAPGLSDLDFVVVLRDWPEPDVARYIDRAQLPADASRTMARATLMVMAEKDFPHITRWDDVRLVRRLGPEMVTVHLEGRALFLTEICRIIDWLPWQIARLTRVIATRRIPVVTAIGWLYSLTYSLRRLETIFNLHHDRWQVFRDQITNFRERYFTDPEDVDERLVSLIIEGHVVACDALRMFAEQIVSSGVLYGPTRAPEARLTVPGGIVLDFVARPEVPSSGDLVSAATESTTTVHLPAALARHFAVYGRSDGIIGRRLRMAFVPPVEASEASQVAGDMRVILQERISACDRWASFLRDNDIRHGLFKFAWFFEQHRSDGVAGMTSR